MLIRPNLKIKSRLERRLSLYGRIRMSNLIQMREPEFAREVAAIERDPLFQTLFYGRGGLPRAILRQRWPGGRLCGSCFGLAENVAGSGAPAPVEEFLARHAGLVSSIQQMGVEAFERYFIHASEPLPLEDIARRTGLDLAEVRAINDLLLEIGAHVAAQPAGREPAPVRSFVCLARVGWEEGLPTFEFFFPHWARGLYQVRYDLLEQWKMKGILSPRDMRRLPGLLRRIEAANMRQNTLFRIVQGLVRLQSDFLVSHRTELQHPISQRQFARTLQLSPSTVSRALGGRSVLLPWGEEAPLLRLAPSRRQVVRAIVAAWLSGGARRETDAILAARLETECGIRVSRRTVTTVRHELGLKTSAVP